MAWVSQKARNIYPNLEERDSLVWLMLIFSLTKSIITWKMGLQVYLWMIALVTVIFKIKENKEKKTIKNTYFYEIVAGTLHSVRGEMGSIGRTMGLSSSHTDCSVSWGWMQWDKVSRLLLPWYLCYDGLYLWNERQNKPFIHTLFLLEYFIIETGKEAKINLFWYLVCKANLTLLQAYTQQPLPLGSPSLLSLYNYVIVLSSQSNVQFIIKSLLITELCEKMFSPIFKVLVFFTIYLDYVISYI